MLTSARRDADRHVKQPYLTLHLFKNPDYDESLGDACKGDLKNLWPDLRRFETELQTDAPHIYKIWLIGRNIKYFPITAAEAKNHVNASATEYGLDNKLDQFDRSTELGRNKVKSELFKFLSRSQNNYWLNEHGPIIEGLLSDYNLKLEGYYQEKPKFCYDLYELCYCWGFELHDGSKQTCEDAPSKNRKDLKTPFDFEYFPHGADGGLIFQKPISKTQE